MKTATKINSELVEQTLADLSEGLQPIIQNLDVTKLTETERNSLLQKLDELEAKALEVKNNLLA